MTEQAVPTLKWVSDVATTQGPENLSAEQAIDWINQSTKPAIIDNEDDDND